MNIAVCVKQTADTESIPKLSSDQSHVSDEGIVWIINPHDESAIEIAIRLRGLCNGSVTLFSVGPERVESALRQGLSMGADEAVHLLTDAMPVDQKIIAELLARRLKSQNFDLIITGEVAIDGGGAQVPQRLAKLLHWSCVTAVEELHIEATSFTARQPVEQGDKIHKGQLPAVIGINRRIMEPRYPSFKGIMKAKRKEIVKESVELESPSYSIESLRLSAPRSEGKVVTYQQGVVDNTIKFLQEKTSVI